MSDLGNKEIFAKNLQHYMELYKLNRYDIAKIADVPYSTVASWCNALYYPRIDKIELLANHFNILKSDLVEDKNNNSLTQVPIIGNISAGMPILATENIEGYLPFDTSIYGLQSASDLFFLHVKGESMNLKVKDGDYVLVHQQNYADDGDIIVALVNGDDATLKKYKRLNDQFVLLEPMSSDASIQSITVDLKEVRFQIIGKAIGHFGKL